MRELGTKSGNVGALDVRFVLVLSDRHDDSEDFLIHAPDGSSSRGNPFCIASGDTAS